MTKEQIASKYLNNEKILWQGQPEKVPVFNKWDIFLIPFTLLLGIPMIFYAVVGAIATFTGNGAMFALVGITALIIGIYILVLRFWYRKKRIMRQLYFVTEKRVLAFDTMRDEVIFDILLTETDASLSSKSLILAYDNFIGDFIYNIGLDIFLRKFVKETPAFYYIKDIAAVSKIIAANKAEKEADDDSLFI